MRELLAFGAPVRCRDEPFGELQDLVADPVRKRVTSLVVEPKHLQGGTRLVSANLVHEVHADTEILLDCPLAAAHELPEVQVVSQYRLGQAPVGSPEWDVGVRDVMSMPFYDAGTLIEYSPAADPELLMTFDRIPKGQVELRRTSLVTTSDGGAVGRVTGLFIDGHEITHVATARKHLGRRRSLAIPMTEVLELATDNVTVRLNRDELDRLDFRHVSTRRRR
jgi:hypothetical protein